jgi:hypothetical protein
VYYGVIPTLPLSEALLEDPYTDSVLNRINPFHFFLFSNNIESHLLEPAQQQSYG